MERIIQNIILAIILIFFQNVNFAQAPNLGAASSFALFTSVGAFNNTGTATNVTGDVGTNGGAFDAFPQGTLYGQKHIEDATSAQAATDIATAYSFLSGVACGVNIGTPLGDGQTLSPNVYCIGAASTINADLTLDGQGDPNALFIFKINGALSTNALSNVFLINSATKENVYWQISGDFNLGINSVFKGTIIGSGAISLANGSSLEGRALSSGGAISMNNNNVLEGLPIELISFTIKSAGVFVLLEWTTASEINNNYFTLERSVDGNNFKTISTISGAGNSNTFLHYSEVDYEPQIGTSYYRLKQTDFNGDFAYSGIVVFERKKSIDFTIYPDPFSAFITIKLNDEMEINNSEFKIYNVSGTEVLSTILMNQITIVETSNLKSGIYFFKVVESGKIIQSGKLISQNYK